MWARSDFLWPAQRTIGEADGKGKYRTPEDLYAEKRREDQLRGLGFEVVRWGWADVAGPDWALRERVLAAFARAGRRS